VIKIDIEQDGQVYITSVNAEMAERAKKWVEDLVRDVAVGEEYEGTVTDIIKDRMRGNEIGAIVEMFPGKDGMVHISNISHRHIANVSDVLKIGDKVKVKVMEVDKERGKVSLSMKALEPLPEGYVEEPHRGAGGFRGPRGGGRPDGGFRDRGPRRNFSRPPSGDTYGSGTKF